MLEPTNRLKRRREQYKLILPQTAELVEKFTELICDVSLSINEYTRKNRIGVFSNVKKFRNLISIYVYQFVCSIHL